LDCVKTYIEHEAPTKEKNYRDDIGSAVLEGRNITTPSDGTDDHGDQGSHDNHEEDVSL
jgi:hypothetical protein